MASKQYSITVDLDTGEVDDPAGILEAVGVDSFGITAWDLVGFSEFGDTVVRPEFADLRPWIIIRRRVAPSPVLQPRYTPATVYYSAVQYALLR